ncbi:hypothetical protein C1645_735775 [Glomus cerebriforme]|uniref:Uncharacterized protein n=1 Tax=Glomus cerebriforme TaxID=658196 RepID=A0A397TDU0_9GLOM|nr:hypothetical protein C1645_735775 [Glomus cerebriforme]
MNQLAILFVFFACLLSSTFAQTGCETCSKCTCPDGPYPPPSSSSCFNSCNLWNCYCPQGYVYNCNDCMCYGRPDRDNGNPYRNPDGPYGSIRGFNCDCSGCNPEN